MKIEEIATVRTGAVTGRKKATGAAKDSFSYQMLNLKCIAPEGFINLEFAENYQAKEKIKPELLTRKGDILIRLSFPYTSVLIEDATVGLLVPSHFAIIRVKDNRALPEYILWYLKRENIHQQILQNSSGSTAFGTISSGFIGSLNIRLLPIKKQQAIGQLFLLSSREQELLYRLAREKAAYNKEILNIIYTQVKGEE